MQLTLSIAIIQVHTSVAFVQFLRFYCNYVGVVLSATFILVEFFISIMQVTVPVEIIQLEVSVPFMEVKVSAANMWVTIFSEIMHVEVSVTIMQVVFSTVHYAQDYFYCNYASDWL